MDDEAFGTSPNSIFNYDIVACKRQGHRESHHLEITDFVRQLPKRIIERKTLPAEMKTVYDPVMDIIRRIQLSQQEMDRFAHFDLSRSYTRNLVATDNTTYTLLLLCWTPGMHSPIHDHPCDGCWMKVLKGQIRERRFQNDAVSERLLLTKDEIYDENEAVYMEDSFGLHSVGNASATCPAVTLHLYCPPIKQCKVWMNDVDRPETVTLKHFSEYGCIL